MITQVNDYKTTTLGLFGNDQETYFVNKNGRMYCVQSPDLAPGQVSEINDNRLPVDCVVLGDKDAQDIEIPEWVYEAA
jgi:hypothetical protein